MGALLAQPVRFSVSYSFSGFQVDNPTTPLPADQVETAFGNVRRTTDQIIDNLAILQRDDGFMKNGVVHPLALRADTAFIMGAKWVPQGDWASGFNYQVGHVVKQDAHLHVCVIPHMAATWVLDNSRGYWMSLDQVGSPSGRYVDPPFIDVGAVAAAWTLDGSAARRWKVTLGSTSSLVSIPQIVAENGVAVEYEVYLYRQTEGVDYSVTWPQSVRWVAGQKPVLGQVANCPDVVALRTWDKGLTWLAWQVGGGTVSGDTGAGEVLPVVNVLDASVVFEASPGAFALGMSAYDAAEGGTLAFTVERQGGSGGTVGVTYAFVAGTASSVSDFPPTTGTLTWEAGDADPKLVTVDMPFDIAVDDAETFTIQLSGPTGGATLGTPASATVTIADAPNVSLSWLSTSGNQIVDDGGTPVRLASVNWFGAEGTNYTPHGTWTNNWQAMINQIKALGFNCIRLPISGDFMTPGRTPPDGVIDENQNPDLIGLTSLEILDEIVTYCGNVGLRIVLDHHRRAAGAGADGAPTDGSYSQATWIANLVALATRYVLQPAMCGIDLHNEPHDLTWDAWATLAEAAGDAIHAANPELLIFVEGVGSYAGESYWWGGQLKGVADRPVGLTVPNKLVYSPHEYGHSVSLQSWLQYDGNTVSGWPDNLYAIWQNAWGFIFEQDIAPVWVGEMGGFFGYDGSGLETKPYATEERQWFVELSKYLNGDFDGDGSTDLTGSELGFSFAYWALNPNSGDTGGLLQDDWETLQTGKLALLAPLVS